MRIAALSVFVGGCAASPTASVTRVELGTGTNMFATLQANGSNVELVHGVQGGWHVPVAVRIWTDDPAGPEGLTLSYEARPPAGAMLGMTHLQLDASRFLREQDHWLRLGDRVVLDVSGAADVVGMTLDLSVNANDVVESKLVTVVDLMP